MQASDIMTTAVIAVSPEDTVQQLARVLTDGGISGAPVLGEGDELVGIVTEADVISKHGSHVRDVMQRSVITIREDASVEEVSHTMSSRNINRLPVVRESRVVGIITRADVVRAIARGHIEAATLVDSQEARRRPALADQPSPVGDQPSALPPSPSSPTAGDGLSAQRADG